MTQPARPSSDSKPTPGTCDRCGKDVTAGHIFTFKAPRANVSPEGAGEEAGLVTELNKCFSCALQHRPMLKRSLVAALVVGTILTVLNQGDVIMSGQWSGALYWKIPLTYCVPLLVATYGALTNSRK